MQGMRRTALYAGFTLFLVTGIVVAEPITIKYTKDDELRTSLRWIALRPSVIQLPALAAASVPGGLAPPEKAAGLSSQAPINHEESAVGKLLFVTPGGKAASCTAAVIGKDSVLFTAARCMIGRDGKQNRDFVFVTAFGSAAQQIYPISCVAFPSEWVRLEGPEAWRHNYAFLRTSRRTTFGGFGVTNAFPPKQLVRVGYSDSVGEGGRMQLGGSGTYITRDGLVGSVFDALAAGSSGNPWIRNSIVHSLSSHYDPAYPDKLLGPRITGATMKLLAHIRKQC